MKRLLLAAALSAVSFSALADVSVGATINIGAPDFYGRINVGDVPEPPRLIYREPRIIEHVTVVHEPVYMRVPPGHAKHWEKHCHQYNACNRPVYFVEDDWYENTYAPHYKAKHGGDHHEHHDGGDHYEHHDGGDHDGDHHGGGHGKGKKGGKGKH